MASNDAAYDKHELDVVMACASDVPTLEALAAMRKKKLETGQGSLHRSIYELNRPVAQVVLAQAATKYIAFRCRLQRGTCGWKALLKLPR